MLNVTAVKQPGNNFLFRRLTGFIDARAPPLSFTVGVAQPLLTLALTDPWTQTELNFFVSLFCSINCESDFLHLEAGCMN